MFVDVEKCSVINVLQPMTVAAVAVAVIVAVAVTAVLVAAVAVAVTAVAAVAVTAVAAVAAVAVTAGLSNSSGIDKYALFLFTTRGLMM